eukprot:144155_1
MKASTKLTSSKSTKLAKTIAKHFKHHSELPMRLDKYLMMYNGFYKTKANEFITTPNAIQIYDERQQKIISCSTNDSNTNTNIDTLKPIKHNTLIYPHERIIISNKKLICPIYQYFMLYKPNGMRGDLYENEYENRCISKWIQFIANNSERNKNLYRLRLVGRMDIDCSGLILCTNDGILTDLLKSPSIGIDRTYRCDISRNHHENKFSNIWTLQRGTQLKKDIGWIDAVQIKPRGRLDNVDTLILDNNETDNNHDELEKNEIEKDKIMEQKIAEIQVKNAGDIPLKKELGHDILDDKQINEHDLVNEDEVEGIKGSDKYYRKYLKSLKRQTRWDITIKHGQHKIMKRMIKNLGFNVENIERIGYGPFLIGEDGKDFKQWNIGGKTEDEVLRLFDEEKEEELNDNVYKQLYDNNCVELNDIQMDRLWDVVGGGEVGVIARLNSLFERANKLNDIQFMDWLRNEYHVKI